MDDLDLQRIKNIGMNTDYSSDNQQDKAGCLQFGLAIFLLIITIIILFLIKK